MDAYLHGRPMPSGFAIGLLLVAIYAVLRIIGLYEPLWVAWTAVAVAATLLSPFSGLTVLAALGPFTEALTDKGQPTAIPFLLAALGAGVAIRVVLSRPLARLSLPLALAILLLAGTALGVLHSVLAFDTQRGLQAAEGWVPGIGGALTVLLAAAWLAWRGELRPLIVGVTSIVVAALASLADFASGGSVLGGPLEWLLRAHNPYRLEEILPAPNAAAAIFAVGSAVCLAVALFHPRPALRLLALGATAVSLAALSLTYSRSGWLAIGLILGVLAWHWRPKVGLVAVAGIVAVVVVVVAAGLVRDMPLAADLARFDAWMAAIRMWLADPLLGHGFRSFEWLHADYGSPILDAPHNEWLRLFAEEGIAVGLAGVAFALATPVLLLRTPGYIAAGAGAATAGLFLMACFNNPFLYTQVNVPAFLIIGTGLGVWSASRQRDTQAVGTRVERSHG
jgi:hypothetical protein